MSNRPLAKTESYQYKCTYTLHKELYRKSAAFPKRLLSQQSSMSGFCGVTRGGICKGQCEECERRKAGERNATASKFKIKTAQEVESEHKKHMDELFFQLRKGHSGRRKIAGNSSKNNVSQERSTIKQIRNRGFYRTSRLRTSHMPQRRVLSQPKGQVSVSKESSNGMRTGNRRYIQAAASLKRKETLNTTHKESGTNFDRISKMFTKFSHYRAFSDLGVNNKVVSFTAKKSTGKCRRLFTASRMNSFKGKRISVKAQTLRKSFKADRFPWREIPTQSIINKMEITQKLNQSKSEQIDKSKENSRPSMVEASYRPLEQFLEEAIALKEEVKPLLKRTILYQGRYDDAKKTGKGDFVFPNGDFYRGNFSNDLREGFGTLVSFKNNFVYKGEFKQDEIRGNGICLHSNGMIIDGFYIGEQKLNKDTEVKVLYTNGEVYEGRWRENKRSGKGKHIYSDYSIYDGNWLDDERHGNGKMTLPNNSFIIGEFKNDVMISGSKYIDENRNIFEPMLNGDQTGKFYRGRLYGYGKANFVNGDFYEGMFKDGKRCGKGKMQYKNIKKFNDEDNGSSYPGSNMFDVDWAIYEGMWNDNCRHGQGTMRWSDESQFEGEWRKDKRYYGTMVMVTGEEYRGYWENDRFHGKGKITTPEGIIFEGEFINGFREKYGKIFYEDRSVYTGELEDWTRQGIGKLEGNGDIYEGEFDDNRKNGEGKMYYKNGDYYSGSWLEDKREGNGTMFYKATKEVYEGEWNRDIRSGIGKLIMPNGKTIECEWRNDKAQGEGKLYDS
ncbi:unnamed protein product [Moneuplotes crassus]|uniref:Phosphatidylinositol-4-phosphate 5-kinase n=1 Tax=Euplotes crassus TaxID=5936 RepID=A0AAD1XSV2_EUPCR|nr:unnamed protein product [Moneuplotes crassus]